MPDDIPQEIFTEIASYAGHASFRQLKKFLKMGKAGREAAYADDVLKEVNLQEFFNEPSMANHGSWYRLFFEKCFEKGNPIAIYLEGLRIAVKNGPKQHALCLLSEVSGESPYASFATAIFLMCEGDYNEGMVEMRKFFSKCMCIRKAVNIADEVMNQIVGFGPCFPGKYTDTFKYDDLPACVFESCKMNDCCFECLAYWYAFAVMSIC